MGIAEAGFGGVGYNEKFGLCFIKTYCLQTYVHIYILAAFTVIPATVIVGCNYVRIIKKILAVQRNVRKYAMARQSNTRKSSRDSTKSAKSVLYQETALKLNKLELSVPEGKFDVFS